VGTPAAVAADIGVEQRGADCSQMAVGRACRMAAGIGDADTAVLAGRSQRAGHRRKTHGGTSRQTSARKWAGIAWGSHTGSAQAAGSSAEGILVVGIADSPGEAGDTVVEGLPVAGSRNSGQERASRRR
jgi:hypothetical protein